MEMLDAHQRQVHAMQSAMPTRPLTLKNAGDGGLITQIFYILAGLGVFLGLSYLTALSVGEMLEDRKIAANPVEVPTAVVSGSCKGSKIPFLRGCDVTISNAGTTVKHDFSFFSFSKKDYDVKVLAQKDNPKNMNVDLATEHFLNRILSAIGLFLIGLVGLGWAGGVYKALPNKQRLKKLFNTPESQPWELVALPVRYEHDSLYYDNTIDGVTKEMDISCHSKKPFFLGHTEDTVAAIKAKNTQTYVPLLQDLSNIDMNKSEEKALLKAYKTFDNPENIKIS